MKNPFIKNESSNGVIVAAFLASAAIAGAITYYFTERKRAKAAAAEAKEHAQDYLKVKPFKKKQHKSDIDDIKGLVNS